MNRTPRRPRLPRRALLALAGLASASHPAWATPVQPLATSDPAAASLLERLRGGGLVLFVRHADTLGEPCDRDYVVGRREGQRNLSPRGRAQARAIGAELAERGIGVHWPVLAGPVFRARDTAEIAFGVERVQITQDLLADDYAGGRLAEVLEGHRRLLSQPVAAGANRVLVGHRTPAVLVVGEGLAGRALPEGGAAVLRPHGERFQLLGVLMPAPIEGAGFHGC